MAVVGLNESVNSSDLGDWQVSTNSGTSWTALSGISAIAWNDPNAPWQEKKNEPTRAHTIPSLDKPAMRLYGIFSTVEGPWGAGGGMTWTDEDVSAASHLEMAFPVR